MAGAQQSSRETQRYIEKARSERHGPNALLGCKHPQNLEYALFFNYMMQSSVERNGEEAQWSKTLSKIVGSLRKLPSRVRSLEHANAIHGVGPKTLDLFRMYLTAHPPDPPSDAELLADERAAEATRAAKDAEKARKKAEREAKKRAADDAREKSARARWRVYYDDARQMPYYYDSVEKTSRWDRPEDFEEEELSLIHI